MHTTVSAYWSIAVYLTKQFGLGVLLFCSVAFGFGMNGHFPAWAFCFVPLVMTIVLFPRQDEWWFGVVLKHVWITILVTLGYTLGFIGSFSSAPDGTDSTSTLLILAIAFGFASILTLFCVLPFYRTWRRFVTNRAMSGLSLALLSLVFPTLYTATFFLLLSFPGFIPLGDFPHPTYTWTTVKPVIMFASVFGIHGIIFLVTWSGFGAYLLTSAPREIRARSRPVLLVTAAVVMVALSWGSIQALAAEGSFLSLPTSTYAGKDVTMACVTSLGSFNSIDFSSKKYDLVIFSELCGSASMNYIDRLRNISKQYRVSIVYSYSNTTGLDGYKYRNMALLINESGDIVFEYIKRNPSPPEIGFMVPGPGIIPTAEIGAGRASLAICQDFDFPRYMATAPKSDILLQPSQTWGHIGKYHAEINAVRAIEQGAVLARCSESGFSGVYVPWGEWRAFVPTVNVNPIPYIEMRMPSKAGVWTLYHYIGDLFAWIVVVAAFGLWTSVLTPDTAFERIPLRYRLPFFENTESNGLMNTLAEEAPINQEYFPHSYSAMFLRTDDNC